MAVRTFYFSAIKRGFAKVGALRILETALKVYTPHLPERRNIDAKDNVIIPDRVAPSLEALKLRNTPALLTPHFNDVWLQRLLWALGSFYNLDVNHVIYLSISYV